MTVCGVGGQEMETLELALPVSSLLGPSRRQAALDLRWYFLDEQVQQKLCDCPIDKRTASPTSESGRRR